MDRRLDPRSIVTPYAFSVHPDLLGRPLATPGQRLGAILVDLVVIFFISQIGLAPLAIASVLLLFWLATRKPGRDVLGRVFRIAVGCLGFLILVVTAGVVLWIRYGDDLRDLLEEAGTEVQVETGATGPAVTSTGPGESRLGLGEIVQGFRGAAALQTAETEEEARTLMNDLVRGAFDSGFARAQIRSLLESLVPADAAWEESAPELIDGAMGLIPLDQAGALPPRGEEAQPPPGAEPDVQESPEGMSPALQDSIDHLIRRIRTTEESRADLQTALDRSERALELQEGRSALSWLWNLIDDLGIGFGWGALYLTITHAWWRGTSIGKKLFRIRVVMIDMRPLNWWLSFERAGGYAAGFATGLLGFAQIFWDPNRQAIHDKVSETVVIQDGKAPVPGPWIEEGRAQWTRGRDEPPGAKGA